MISEKRRIFTIDLSTGHGQNGLTCFTAAMTNGELFVRKTEGLVPLMTEQRYPAEDNTMFSVDEEDNYKMNDNKIADIRCLSITDILDIYPSRSDISFKQYKDLTGHDFSSEDKNFMIIIVRTSMMAGDRSADDAYRWKEIKRSDYASDEEYQREIDLGERDVRLMKSLSNMKTYNYDNVAKAVLKKKEDNTPCRLKYINLAGGHYTAMVFRKDMMTAFVLETLISNVSFDMHVAAMLFTDYWAAEFTGGANEIKFQVADRIRSSIVLNRSSEMMYPIQSERNFDKRAFDLVEFVNKPSDEFGEFSREIKSGGLNKEIIEKTEYKIKSISNVGKKKKEKED